MTESLLPDRGRTGYEVYAAGMEASALEKARLLPFVRPGVIAEIGCGTGTVLELLRRTFPDSRLVGVDLSPEMLRRCRERFPALELVRGDAVEPIFEDGSVDTLVLCSTLHEVFSYKGYDYSAVRRALRLAAAALRPEGRLILRDGVKPAQHDVVFMTFLNEETLERFHRFAREFGSSPIVWRWIDGRAQVARRDAMEFLSKYIYHTNWAHEVKEHFGVFTLEEWKSELAAAGLRVLHAESYLIEWLRATHYEKDVRLEVRRDDGYAPTDYPHSTMILVGAK